MESNPLAGILGLLMMLQLGVVLLILLGGLYALYCLNRAASGLDRMASAVENWVAQAEKIQARQTAQSKLLDKPVPAHNPPSDLSNLPIITDSTPPDETDWMRPIELSVNAPPSNSTPEVINLKPPQILPVSPPFGNQSGPESEKNRE